VGFGFEQRLVFVLAVDVDQQLAEGLEVAHWGGRTVDIAARATFGGDYPAQDARAVAVEVALGEPGTGLWNITEIEAGEDIGLVRAGSHHAAVGAIAQAQTERVEHDRFAGTSFPGDDAHAALKFEIKVLDDGVIVYGQVHQHGDRSGALSLVIYTVLYLRLTMLVGWLFV
jgi:hypothetical protein